jgi:wyosine [tRNA(Phe)-imidazoG37] synthetase (radical SAM superfamily)
MKYKHLFGPVNSRRLGASLGVNLIPHKTCDLDCVYCECGVTTNLTIDRKAYIPATELIHELDGYLSENPSLDYVTFCGHGEPTLNSDLSAILLHVKTKYPQYKTALLTNATLFYLPEVRKECLGFDVICPSLDAISSTAFAKVNRNHQGLNVRKMIRGLIDFSHEFKGKLWLEIFIVPGVNDSPSEIALFKETIPKIRVDRIQINSLDRKAPCDWVQIPSLEELQRIAAIFSQLGIPVDIVSRAKTRQQS